MVYILARAIPFGTMDENWNIHFPKQLSKILRETEAAGFRMASDERTGSLLRTLAGSKPKGALLELGTGTGVGTSWLLSGMDASSTLDTVDNDKAVVDIARRYLGHDSRVCFHVADGATFSWTFATAGLTSSSPMLGLASSITWMSRFRCSDPAACI